MVFCHKKEIPERISMIRILESVIPDHVQDLHISSFYHYHQSEEDTASILKISFFAL